MGATATMLEEVGELLGTAVTLDGYLGRKGRAVVARVRREDGTTLVVKGQRIPDDPTTVEDDPWSPPNRFRNEVAALRVLHGADGLVPALLAADGTRQWMVLEDLGPVSSLADTLLGGDRAAAETALCGWASAIGRLHRFTADAALLSEWERARRALGGAIPHESATEVLARLRPTLEELVPVGPGVTSAAREIDRRLGTRDWWVLSPRDACPDNCAHQPDGTYRLFDFEGAGARHALLDAAYLVSPFPSCWCTGPLPDPPRRRALEAYRAASAWPHDDAVFRSHLSAAAAFHVLWVLELWLPRALTGEGATTMALADVGFVFPSLPQIIAMQLEVLGRAVVDDEQLRPLEDLSGSLARELAQRWGAWELPAPHPAFGL